MADINFDCPHCGHSLDVNERGAGLAVACPECSKNIKIPIPAPELLKSDIKFNCGSCRQPIEALPDMAGQWIDCPACKKPTEIPFPPRMTPPTPTRPAARSTPIPKPPSRRQVPGTGTSAHFAPTATRPPKATSFGLVLAVYFPTLVCSGLIAGMFCLCFKNIFLVESLCLFLVIFPVAYVFFYILYELINSYEKQRKLIETEIKQERQQERQQEKWEEELRSCATKVEKLNTMPDRTDFKVKYADGRVQIIHADRDSKVYTILISQI